MINHPIIKMQHKVKEKRCSIKAQEENKTNTAQKRKNRANIWLYLQIRGESSNK